MGVGSVLVGFTKPHFNTETTKKNGKDLVHKVSQWGGNIRRSAQQEEKLGTQSLTHRFMRRAHRADGCFFYNQTIVKQLCH